MIFFNLFCAIIKICFVLLIYRKKQSKKRNYEDYKKNRIRINNIKYVFIWRNQRGSKRKHRERGRLCQMVIKSVEEYIQCMLINKKETK